MGTLGTLAQAAAVRLRSQPHVADGDGDGDGIQRIKVS